VLSLLVNPLSEFLTVCGFYLVESFETAPVYRTTILRMNLCAITVQDTGAGSVVWGWKEIIL